MKAMCPNCKGQGYIEVQLPEGTLYSRTCKKCNLALGGCVVGGESPLKEIPMANPCPFCGGETAYSLDGEISREALDG